MWSFLLNIKVLLGYMLVSYGIIVIIGMCKFLFNELIRIKNFL